ncbi:MAG TPA: hypothetical protein PLU87_18905 [Sedimentisphaerales bacterium]|nr:hypothetical protein [Sedimentisphaerales bacterium]HRS13161.1 hypothetical protein [Sedimentisphaerales bacterium]HRV49721.1 hypothetical protein [Sedimentisphaerales bacterium]
MTQKEQICSKAVELLENEPRGLRCSELMRRLKQGLPSIKDASFHWTIPDLHVHCPEQILKPARGLFLHAKFRDTTLENDIQLVEKTSRKNTEDEFYESFAAYLADELEECSRAIALGGNCFRDKWGTPDVVGILSPRPSDILKFSTEIISAEIKTDVSALITAFGQACSYRLFSHKVYLVIPNSVSESDLARLDALCRVFGLGLILFDAENPQEPSYQIRVRATKHEPDMFYANRNLKVVEDKLFG